MRYPALRCIRGRVSRSATQLHLKVFRLAGFDGAGLVIAGYDLSGVSGRETRWCSRSGSKGRRLAMPYRPKHPQYYRNRAIECERAAESAISTEARDLMLHVAKRWHA